MLRPQFLKYSLFAAAALLAMACGQANADIIADLDADYAGDQTGWSYLWNPTGADIGAEAGYQALVNSADDFVYDSVTNGADANAQYGSNPTDVGVFDNNFTNAGFDEVSVLQGGKSSTNPDENFNHYVIVGYKVQAGQAGVATMTHDGSVGPPGGEVKVYVNDSEISTFSGSGGTALDFTDLALGNLAVGDDVYFAYRTLDDTAARNPTRLFTQFTIDRTAVVPEPSSLALLGLCGTGLFFRRKRA